MDRTPEQIAKRNELAKRMNELANDAKEFIDEIYPDGEDRVVTEAILVIGTRFYDSEKQAMVGTVYSFIDEESMPGYIAEGLLSSAIKDMDL